MIIRDTGTFSYVIPVVWMEMGVACLEIYY